MNTRVIVIPAYNEEKTISAVIQSIIGLCSFVVVVDDCSRDRTRLIASKFNEVLLVSNKQNLGYSRSLEIGINKAMQAGANYIVTIDADGEHPVEFVSELFDKIESDNLDMVVAVRDKLPRISESIVASISSFFWGIRDITCGMKAYKDTLVNAAEIPKSFDSTGTYLTFFALIRKYKFQIVRIKTMKRLGESR